MNELIIVRHGQAEHHINEMTGGWTNSCLTGLGRKQAERTGIILSSMIKDTHFSYFCSDQLRAVETAELINNSNFAVE